MITGHDFGPCRVGVDTQGWCEGYPLGYAITTFSDKTSSDARPHDTDDYRAYTERTGYGPYVGAYCIEHEIAHTFVARTMGQDFSPVVYADAHHIILPLGDIPKEERVVRAFQRFANGKPASMTNLAGLLEKGIDLDTMVREWRTLITQMFGNIEWYKEEYKDGIYTPSQPEG